MPTVAGVFRSLDQARQAVTDLQRIGLKNINLLTPDSSSSRVDAVTTSDTEQPGMGKAVGGVVGGAVGMAAGLELGTVVATALIPGVGPVLAVGLAAAAVLGIGGAVGGAAAGNALEEESTTGLPADELFVYRDALKQGRSVLFVEVVDEDWEARARSALAASGAESVDAARDEWWIGLRSANQEHYRTLTGKPAGEA